MYMSFFEASQRTTIVSRKSDHAVIRDVTRNIFSKRGVSDQCQFLPASVSSLSTGLTAGISRKVLLPCANGSLSVTAVIFSIGNLGRSCDRRDNDPSSDSADGDVVRRKCREFNDLVTSSPYQINSRGIFARDVRVITFLQLRLQ